MTDRWPHEAKWRSVELDALGHLPKHRHLFEAREVWAIKAALGARRPLLVRGKPGTGKSELARAAAEVLQRPLVSRVISARTESTDLQYSFDAVARLGQAQLLGVVKDQDRLESLEEKRFLLPGPLWWVFNWADAKDHYDNVAHVKGWRPPPPKPKWKWEPLQGTVLLIDEIDKADPDLPNGLLEALGNGEFAVPHLSAVVACSRKPEDQPPLVIITTNEERELPAAFVRRCLVLELVLLEGEALEAWLVERGKAHFGDRIAADVYQDAAHLVATERASTTSSDLVRPGQAEYLDLLRAILDIAKTDAELQSVLLMELKGFALRKNASE